MKQPEIESYSRRTGLELGLFVTEPNRGDYAVKLKPGHARPTDEVISDLRRQIAESEPSLEIEFVGILPDIVGDLQGNPEPIEINSSVKTQARCTKKRVKLKRLSRRCKGLSTRRMALS